MIVTVTHPNGSEGLKPERSERLTKLETVKV